MKISFFDLLLCYIMRHKITVVGVILSLVCVWCTGVKGISFLLFGFAALLFNSWYNSTNLFESKFNKNSFIKRWMYNKYKEKISFKYALVYDEVLMEYHYIPFEDKHFYTCNIYLFVIKTFSKEKFLAYEYQTRHSNTIIFIGSSKRDVAQRFHEFILLDVRKIHNEIRKLNNVCDKHSKIISEIEYHEYGN